MKKRATIQNHTIKSKKTIQSSTSKLNRNQLEVLRLCDQEHLTVKQIAQARQTTIWNVYRILRDLRQKGIKIRTIQSTIQKTGVTQLRLHNEQYNIGILFQSDSFIKNIGKKITIEGNTIEIGQKSINIYSNQSFYGDSVDEVNKNSNEYWMKIINILENDLGIILVKDRKHNIKRVRHHISETNNELAKDCNKKKQKVNIKATEDNKRWLTIDNSYNLNELEATHPKTATEDMQNVLRPFFNDLRNNEPTTISQIKDLLYILVRENKETAAGLSAVVKLMAPQEPKESKDKKIPDYFG